MKRTAIIVQEERVFGRTIVLDCIYCFRTNANNFNRIDRDIRRAFCQRIAALFYKRVRINISRQHQKIDRFRARIWNDNRGAVAAVRSDGCRFGFPFAS